MSNIRLTYPGLMAFVITLISVFTGLVFTLIVTRRLSQDEFGLWSLMGSLLIYVMVFVPINTYWVSRHVARNEEASITGIVCSMLFSLAATAAYIVIIFFISETTDVDYGTLLFSSILIPLMYLVATMRGIVTGFRPQGNAYAILVFELTKIPSGFLLVYWADMGIIGAIITSAIAQGAQVVFYLYYIREKLRERFCYSQFKQWLKLSWLPVFSSLHDRILHLDSTIFTILIGSVTGLSYVGVARAISNLVSNTGSISSALSPKLIASQKVEYLELILKRTLLFSIPAVGFSFIFAKPSLWVLNPLYVDGIYILYVWIIVQFTYVFQGIFAGALTGIEKVDIGFQSKFRDYLKSKLFTIPLVYVVSYLSYIAMLIVVLVLSIQVKLPTLDIIFWWGSVGIISNVAIVLIFWKMTSKNLSFGFPRIIVLKYIIATAIASSISYITLDQFLQYNESIFVFGPSLIPHILLFVGIYFSIMLTWDHETRSLFSQILREFKK
ncbi:MAG: hypothetical protein ACRD9Q_03660 [Nitrososphaeraceae archaeon]